MALRKRPNAGPFALIHRSGNKEHVHCLNAVAERGGLHRGMAAADARAICPDLVTRPADLGREAAALASLRRWLTRYSPLVARDGLDGLIADITGVPHLFGGEQDLLDDLGARLIRVGLTFSVGIADTRGAAYAMARHAGGIIPEGVGGAGIAGLPLAGLRIGSDVVDGLARMGLHKIGDLIPLPRAPLARRFGQPLLMRLDQALGIQSEPIAPEKELEHFGVRMTLPEPIGLQADVMSGLSRLLGQLCAKLAHHHRGARRLRLELHRVDQETVTLDIGLARPMRDPDRIAGLFEKGVSEIDAGFGIEVMRLVSYLTEPLAPEQIGPNTDMAHDAALADLLSRVGNRLGFDRVLRLLPGHSKIPERSHIIASAAYSAAEPVPPQRGPQRPIILFAPEPVTVRGGAQPGHPPARFSWRRMTFTVLRADGPERIAPEWWFDDPAWRTGLRDYWRIETREGPRLWLFHTPQSSAWTAQHWFAQGEFA